LRISPGIAATFVLGLNTLSTSCIGFQVVVNT